MMKYSQNLLNVLSAVRYKGIGKAWVVANWKKDLSDAEIVELINKSTKGDPTSVLEFSAVREDVKRRVEMLENVTDGAVAWMDNDFPYCRGIVKKGEFPIALFYKGDLSLLDHSHQNVAVIGVLKPEESIVEREKKMVASLLKYNYVIVSGLAHGCDSIAHIQTLEENGKTVAILPSTLGNVVPAQHKELAEKIVEHGGLLITEYFEDPQSQLEMRGRYQERDRLQAMFSDAIILTASYDVNSLGNDCGSRLAMEYARQYKIPRYVMYNESLDQDEAQFELNRRILREGESQILTHNKISSLAIKPTVQLGLF